MYNLSRVSQHRRPAVAVASVDGLPAATAAPTIIGMSLLLWLMIAVASRALM